MNGLEASPRYANSSNQHHTTQETMTRGPGTVSSASSVVMPLEIAKRPSSTCTSTLIMQPAIMNHNRLKPYSAPTLGVAINSPEPTMQAVMIRPGPRCLRVPRQSVGASCGPSEDMAAG